MYPIICFVKFLEYKRTQVGFSCFGPMLRFSNVGSRSWLTGESFAILRSYHSRERRYFIFHPSQFKLHAR